MQDREIQCLYYEFEGSCKKGRGGTFWKACQTCNKYKPMRGTSPARKDLRKQKMEKIQKRDIKKILRDY